jgi:AcrR family transcriptional regulator
MTSRSLTVNLTRTPRQRLKDMRPQQLLDAALTLFVEKGFAATRSEEVAMAAGVSKGTLYLYYPSKEELFKAVVRQNMSEMIGEGGDIASRFDGSASDLLVHLFDVWWERVGDSQAGGLHKIVMSEVRNFPELAQFYADEVILPAHRLFEGVIQRGIDRGEFRPVNTPAVAHAVMAPMIFLMLHKHSFGACPVQGPDVDLKATLMAHADLLLRGLQVRPDDRGAAR